MIKIEQFWGLFLNAGQHTKRWSSTLEDWLKHALQQNLAKKTAYFYWRLE